MGPDQWPNITIFRPVKKSIHEVSALAAYSAPSRPESEAVFGCPVDALPHLLVRNGKTFPLG